MKKYIIAGVFVLVFVFAFAAYLMFAKRSHTPPPGIPTSMPNATGPTSLPTTTLPSGNPPRTSVQAKS